VLVRLQLSEPARVRVTFVRLAPGRRVAGHCVHPLQRNRKRPACTRLLRLRGLLSARLGTGPGTITFDGRLAGTQLVAGRYRLSVIATDRAGNLSRTGHLRLVIRPRST
jgi:hypothetical protein